MANNRRPTATRGTFAAPQPIAVSRKQMFIPVHAKRGGFVAPVSTPAREQPSAGFRPDSKVSQRVEIAESPVKRAFRGV